MSKKKETVSGNYLDYIPSHGTDTRFEVSDEGKITIFVENKGVFNWIAQKLFHRPRVSQIHLDKMGNFIWPLMDGDRSIQQIALLVKEQFGDEAEPLYNRLVQYIRNLESYGFVEVKENK